MWVKISWCCWGDATRKRAAKRFSWLIRSLENRASSPDSSNRAHPLAAVRAALPVVDLLRVQSRLLGDQRLHEVAASGGLTDKLRQAWDEGLQRHADVRTAVGLQYLCRHGVQLGLLRHLAGLAAGVCRGGPQDAHLGVAGPEGNQADAHWGAESAR